MKKALFLLLFCWQCFARADFEQLMGKDLMAWEHVTSSEDFENLRFFKAIYEKNIHFLNTSTSEKKIPKLLHFIWVGPRNFPPKSIPYLRSWIEKHPDWTVYFWTDRDRPLPHPAMKRRDLLELKDSKLFCYVDKTDNYAEKADLMRYEILFQEGGIYVDHDMKCFKSFIPLAASYDFFCGLEVPFTTQLSSSVFPTNNLIGCKPEHPILARCIEKVSERWEEIEKKYPGYDSDSVIQRVAHRTFSAFGESVIEQANINGNQDIIFPAFYFNAPKEALAIYAQHLYQGTWFEKETPFEKVTKERLVYLSKKVNKILLACTLMTFLNIFGFAFIILKTKNRIKQHKN